MTHCHVCFMTDSYTCAMKINMYITHCRFGQYITLICVSRLTHMCAMTHSHMCAMKINMYITHCPMASFAINISHINIDIDLHGTHMRVSHGTYMSES